MDPDEKVDLIGLIESRGFHVRSHEVETEDGYILTLFNLINPKVSSSTKKLKPVVLFHGLIDSANGFCINSPHLRTNESKYGDTMAFALLQTERYDVWLANARGTRHSLKHRSLSSQDHEFWNFSWEQISDYDLPAVIEYVLKKTDSKTLGYVGHSQGTLIMFSLLSNQPKYADIIQPFIALAPVAFVGHIQGPFKYLAPLAPLIFSTGGQLIITQKYIDEIAEKFCSFAHAEEVLCENLFFLLMGADAKNFNETRIGVYLHFEPSTTSAWNVLHFAQMATTKRLQRFDYGTWGSNLRHYGHITPPEISLENIPRHAKIALFHGLNDVLADQNDAQILKDILKSNGVELIKDYYIPDPEFTHVDFLIGKHSGKLFINEMINVLDNHTK